MSHRAADPAPSVQPTTQDGHQGPVVIATIAREEGITGVHTHMRQLRRYLVRTGEEVEVVTPHSWARGQGRRRLRGFVLVPLFQSAVMLGLVSFIFGLGTGCGQPIATMMMFSRSTEGRSGEALGLRLTANNLVRVIAPAFFGFIVSGFGLAPVFFINALMMGAGGVISQPKKPL